MADLLELGTQFGITPLLIFCLCFLITMILVQSRRIKTYANLPPRGPREWPVVGSLPSLAGSDEPHVVLTKMAKKHGPIFSMRLGSFYTVVISDFELIRQAFAKSGDDFSDRPEITLVKYIAEGKGLVASYFGPKQAEQRRFSLSALRSLGMGKFRMEETIAEEARHLVASFVSRKSQAFVPFHDIAVSVSNVICGLNFGKRFDYDDEVFKGVLEALFGIIEMTEISGVINFLPFLRFLPGSGMEKILKYKMTFDRYVHSSVEKITSEYTSGIASCFVHMYVDQMREAEKEKPGEHFFSEENLLKAVGDLFIAGTETTSSTLKWCLLYMLSNLEVQKRVQMELDEQVGRDRMPSLLDRKRLPYTESTLLEIQRITSIAPFGVPHAPIKDAVLGGYDIPKGTVIIPNIWAVHHEPSLWENPDQFNPERFLDKETNKVRLRDELIPFCVGRRKCIGEQLAKVELFLFFTHLLHRFHFRLPEGSPPPTMKARSHTTLSPFEYHVCAIPRNDGNGILLAS
ncbi:cytochrome P450 2U1-like [Diadema antillarum]|uniref:cytochrome P450 2U1-like n=1 Tax=Diadema antillarum TaxID=105358 RepID=UPI003A87651C